MVARVEILDCFVGKFEDSFADFATANKTLIAINPKYQDIIHDDHNSALTRVINSLNLVALEEFIIDKMASSVTIRISFIIKKDFDCKFIVDLEITTTD